MEERFSRTEMLIGNEVLEVSDPLSAKGLQEAE